MNIKQIFEKIINLLTGKTSNERKELPVASSDNPKEVSTRKRGFFNSLGNGIPVQETPDLEGTYNTALEDYRIVFEKIEILFAKMQLLANNIQIEEQIDDPIEAAKIEKENYIQKAGEKAAEKERGRLSEQDTRYTRPKSQNEQALDIHSSRNIAKALAEAEWMDNTAKYFNEALSALIQSIIKEKNNENNELSEDEQIKIEIVRKVVQLLIKEKAIAGNLDGMRYAVLKHGLVDSKKAGMITRIDESVKFCEQLSSALKTLADEKAIGVDVAGKSEYMLEQDAIIYDVNRSRDGVVAGVNEMYVKAFRRALEKWSNYIESGGVVPDAGMFEKDFGKTHEYFHMDEEAKKEANKIIKAAETYKAAKGKQQGE